MTAGSCSSAHCRALLNVDNPVRCPMRHPRVLVLIVVDGRSSPLLKANATRYFASVNGASGTIKS